MRTDFESASRRSGLVSLFLKLTAKQIVRLWAIAPWMPWPYALVDRLGHVMRPPRGTTVERVRHGDFGIDLYSTPVSDSGRVIVYFHGGAWIVGGRRLHRELISRLATVTRSTVISVDYRQLPKHDIATGAQDCLDGYRYALAQGTDPADIVFMGDSAGGYFSLVTAALAAEAGLPKPAAIVAMAPLTDFDLERTPMNGKGCAIFPRSMPAALVPFVSARGRSLSLVPMDVDPAALPPVLLQASSAETLFPQVERLYYTYAAAGVPVELQVWDKQVHVFQAAHFLPEAKHAVANIAEYVDRVVPVRLAQTA